MANVLQIIRNKKILSFLQCYYKKLRKISSKLPYSESFLDCLPSTFYFLYIVNHIRSRRLTHIVILFS